MQTHKIPVFRAWVSEWLARAVIFFILMTCLFSFAFFSNPAAVMGFYGVESTDVQYAMVVIYGSTVAFLALDFRIVKYFSPRKYLLMGLAVNIGCSLICFYSRNWALFLICQFIQGVTCAMMSSIVLNLTFPRLATIRARVIGYTILYAGIQVAIPFYTICYSVLLHFFDYNWLFYLLNIMLITLTFITLITMNGKARFFKKIPLYQMDWTGYLFYISFLLTFGYLLVYGRQLGWFGNPLFRWLVAADAAVLLLFIARERKLKRPLIDLNIFKARNFVIGLLLLFTFYIFKGSTGLTYGYLEAVLGNDLLNIIPILAAVISGTIISMIIVSRFILMGHNLIRIIIAGFGIMALYYISMLLFVSVQSETADFIIPMLIYGLAIGTLFVPIVTFTISAAPPKIAINASFIGILARFTGFTASLAVNTEIQLYTKSAVREKLREMVTETNQRLPAILTDIQHQYMNAGNDVYTAKGASKGLLGALIRLQILARATRDYYDWLLVGVVCVIIVLLLLARVKSVVLRLRRGNIPY